MGDWQQTTQRHGAQIIGGRSETRTGRAGVNSGWLQGGDETAIGSPSSFGSIELYKVSDFRGMGTFSQGSYSTRESIYSDISKVIKFT